MMNTSNTQKVKEPKEVKKYYQNCIYLFFVTLYVFLKLSFPLRKNI